MACLYRRRKQFWISYYRGSKQVRRSLHTSDEKVARAKKKRIEYELSLGDLYMASQLRVSVVLEVFCKHLKATRTRKSFKNDFSRLRAFFGPVCESLKLGNPEGKGTIGSKRPWQDKYAGSHVKAEFLEDISPEAINHFIGERLEMNGWSPKTANLMRQILHKFFVYAIKHHGFRSRDRRFANPVTCVERYREPASIIRFLSLEEMDNQLKILKKNIVIRAMVATYIFAGLRREEAVWITQKDIDLEERFIRVQAKIINGQFWQPKTKKNRLIPISNALFEILEELRPANNCIWFFPSPQGKRWDPDNFSQDLRKINRANGLNWSCLDFRHTFGSHLAQKGESLYKISKLMGNSPEICRKHYAALIPEEMTDVVEFTSLQNRKDEDDKTQKILEDILCELKGQGKSNIPNLRLVRFDEPA